MKTNKELNTAHAAKMADKIRPKQPSYDFTALEAVMRAWVKGNE